jgi:hypothetical protein
MPAMSARVGVDTGERLVPQGRQTGFQPLKRL